MKTKIAIALCVFGIKTIGSAADFSIDWSKIAGGGGTSSGGQFSVSGTIGQHDAGQMSGGSFSLVTGFWSAFVAVPTPGAPLLVIQPQGNNVRISWAASATGFVLEQSPHVPGNWSPVSSTYATNATEISVTLPAVGDTQFFRLHAQ
jgi:hypothetical protein